MWSRPSQWISTAAGVPGSFFKSSIETYHFCWSAKKNIIQYVSICSFQVQLNSAEHLFEQALEEFHVQMPCLRALAQHFRRKQVADRYTTATMDELL